MVDIQGNSCECAAFLNEIISRVIITGRYLLLCISSPIWVRVRPLRPQNRTHTRFPLHRSITLQP